MHFIFWCIIYHIMIKHHDNDTVIKSLLHTTIHFTVKCSYWLPTSWWFDLTQILKQGFLWAYCWLHDTLPSTMNIQCWLCSNINFVHSAHSTHHYDNIVCVYRHIHVFVIVIIYIAFCFVPLYLHSIAICYMWCG